MPFKAPQSESRCVDSSRLCPTCGQVLPADARFCPFDGQELGKGSGQRIAEESGRCNVVRIRETLVGSIVDERYEVLQLLGEGGMGSVYRVRHRVLGRLLALKALRPEYARDGALAERFVQEARAAAAITHPHVVSITDFGMIDRGQPYFVMELLDGLTLSSVMRERGALDPLFVVGVGRSVASALAAAHDVGVIHRDLKPDNIILLGDASVPTALKVLDFGLARVLGASRLTRDDVVFGTPQYMSPEQASGEDLDPRVDIYALGILMYEMLTGRVPFQADSYLGVLTQQIYSEPTPPSVHCPALTRHPKLEAIVLTCLRKQREERLASMHEVIQALDELCSDVAATAASADSGRRRTVSSIRPQLDSRVVRRKKQRRRWWPYVLLGAVALGVALGLLYGRLSSESHSMNTTPSSQPEETDAHGVSPSGHGVSPTGARVDQGSGRVSARSERLHSESKSSGTPIESRSRMAREKRATDRPDRQRVGRTEGPAASGDGSFVGNHTSGSSEIGNPWPQ